MTVHVVGMGLAGSWITWELLLRGIRVITSDHTSNSTSSRIAAGLVNPVTGIPPKENWNGDVILNASHTAYQRLEQSLGVRVWHEQNIRRVFAKTQDKLQWDAAAERGLCTKWIPIPAGNFEGIDFPFGGVEYTGATVDTNVLLNAVSEYSTKAASEFSERAASELSMSRDTSEAPSLTIWCEGWLATQNDLWRWLPFQPVKGEILDVEIDPPFLNAIHIGGCWIVPQHSVDHGTRQRIRIGSTYDWDDLTSAPTEKVRTLLLQRATDIVARPMKVVGHNAAIRPAAQSKRPYLGRHPMHPEHAILNGFGAKGALWAPWAAQHLATHLFDGQALNAEVDVQRWWLG